MGSSTKFMVSAERIYAAVVRKWLKKSIYKLNIIKLGNIFQIYQNYKKFNNYFYFCIILFRRFRVTLLYFIIFFINFIIFLKQQHFNYFEVTMRKHDFSTIFLYVYYKRTEVIRNDKNVISYKFYICKKNCTNFKDSCIK
jgi:hypothetical protein